MMLPLEPSPYTNQFGMNEYQEEKFIHYKIEKFCSSQNKDSNLYDTLYEYIQDNLEKFMMQDDHDE